MFTAPDARVALAGAAVVAAGAAALPAIAETDHEIAAPYAEWRAVYAAANASGIDDDERGRLDDEVIPRRARPHTQRA